MLLILEKLVWGKALEKAPAPLRHLYTLFFVLVGWALFSIEDGAQLGPYLAAMFGFAGGGLADPMFFYCLKSYLPMFVIAVVAATPLVKNLWHKLPDKAQKVLCPVLMVAGMLLATAYLVDGTYNPFLSSQF